MFTIQIKQLQMIKIDLNKIELEWFNFTNTKLKADNSLY